MGLVISVYLSSLPVAYLSDTPRRRLVDTGDRARIQGKTAERSAWFFNVLGVKHRQTGPRFKVSSERLLIFVNSLGIEPTKSIFQVERSNQLSYAGWLKDGGDGGCVGVLHSPGRPYRSHYPCEPLLWTLFFFLVFLFLSFTQNLMMDGLHQCSSTAIQTSFLTNWKFNFLGWWRLWNIGVCILPVVRTDPIMNHFFGHRLFFLVFIFYLLLFFM